MIRYLGPLEDLSDLEQGCAHDPVLGARVQTYARCYGARFLFCDIWVIYGPQGEIQGSISRYNGTMTIAADPQQVDPQELALFCQSTSAVEFEGDVRLLDRIQPFFPPEEIRKREDGWKMCWAGGTPPPPTGTIQEGKRLGQVHELLCQCFTGFSDYSPFAAWYVDVSARIRRDICQIWNVLEGDSPVATAGVYYRQPGCGVIACVGTLPEKRGRGYGREAVLACVRQLLACGDTPYLTTAQDSLARFYQGMGFEICGRRGSLYLR